MPSTAGEYGFACGMNMLHGTLVVEAGNGNGDGSLPAPSETAASTEMARAAVQGDGAHIHEVARAVGVGQVREVKGMSRVEFGLRGGGVTCPTCIRNIEGVVDRMSGVDDVEVNISVERVSVAFGPIPRP